MRILPRLKFYIVLLLYLVSFLFLSACGDGTQVQGASCVNSPNCSISQNQQGGDSGSGATPTDTPAPTPTDTPVPTPTDTPVPTPTDTPVPTPTDTPVPTDTPSPSYPQLNASYSGHTSSPTGYYLMNMYISESSQGSINAQIDYDTNPLTSYTCSGQIDYNYRITLTCQSTSPSVGYTLLLSGYLYSDGHLEGYDSAKGQWYLI